MTIQDVLAETDPAGFAIALGDHVAARESTVGFRALTAPEQAIQRALTVFPDAHPPRDAAAREISVAGLPPDAMQRLQGLDGEFFAYQDDLTGLTRAYVSAHAGAFPT